MLTDRHDVAVSCLRAERVLVHRQGSLGDTVVALPALHVVRRAFPNASIRLLTSNAKNAVAAPALQLLKGSGLADGAIDYPVRTRDPWEIAKVAFAIRSWKPDAVVYLVEARSARQHRRDALFMRLCGVNHLFGYDPMGGLSDYLQLETVVFESEAARLLRAVQALGSIDARSPEAWHLHISNDERAVATQLLGSVPETKPIIAFSIGTKAQTNDYGDKNWAAVLRKLGADARDVILVGLGARGEAQRTAGLLETWPGATVNLCGLLAVRESAAVLERSSLFMGHDSGPMHLAAAMGTPCVAVFSGRNRVGVWSPQGPRSEEHVILRNPTSCSPCGLVECVIEKKRCIFGIQPDSVAMEASRMLHQERKEAALRATPGALASRVTG